MTASVKCPSCGARNDVSAGRLFCNQCSGKLDLSRVRFTEPAKSGFRYMVKRVLRVTVLVVLLAILVLLVLPAEPRGLAGTEEDGRACFDKLSELFDAIERGAPLQRVFHETEVNGYFEVLLDEAVTDPLDQGRGLNVRAINLSFTDQTFIVHIRANWHMLQLTYEVEGRPVLQERGFETEVVRVTLGHLPIPGPMQERFAERLLPLFEQMERERYVLDHLSRIDLAPRQVRLTTGR